MRLWSIHPKYLDPKGLVALWREGLLAQKVLEGKTKGYRQHPQLLRFREAGSPLAAIRSYLHDVADEAEHRGYRFDRSRIRGRAPARLRRLIPVTRGQLEYELEHLRGKLRQRERGWELPKDESLPHPLFRVMKGPIEAWERLKPSSG